MAASPLSVCRFFHTLCDPRRCHRRKHLLLDIVVIALCAVISGAKDWQQVVAFGRGRLDWLKTFLRLPHGIPFGPHGRPRRDVRVAPPGGGPADRRGAALLRRRLVPDPGQLHSEQARVTAEGSEMGVFGSVADALAFAEQYLVDQMAFGEVQAPRQVRHSR